MMTMIRFLTFLILFGLNSTVFAQPEEFKGGWPRAFTDNGNTIIIHQPQLEEWDRYEVLRAKSAINVKLNGDNKEYVGAVFFETDTETALEDRQVLLKNLRVKGLEFPNLDKDVAAKCTKAFNAAMPKGKQLLVSLDRLIAAVPVNVKKVNSIEVNLDPPSIFYSDSPAILVIFMGEPKLEPVKEKTNLRFAVNTNWTILSEIDKEEYYLLNGDNWLVSKDLVYGPWKPAEKQPKSFSKLPEDKNWKEVKKHLKANPEKNAPQVFVSQKPAELIVTLGTPTLSPISKTSLFYITNTETDIFYHEGNKFYYYLAAGRWFRSSNLKGPWKASSERLPADFMLIPADHPKAHVLASIPGTSEAKAAVVMASIPQKATVPKSTTVKVVYEGEPKFVVIDGTKTVYYAVNTPYSVLMVNGRYYCVNNGVWFISGSPDGPWAVATKVPKVIYTIPPNHPLHNVTYVYIYDSTGDTVVVGYTSGYTGTYVATTGVIMFGVGYWYGYSYYPYPYYHYYPYYYSYGCAYRYDYYYGTYYRSASYYGPYGGAGGWAGYDPGSGTYYRGGYAYGPNGSIHARQAYNPNTDRSAAQVGAKTPYGSWGRSVVSDGDNWVRGGHRSEGPKTVGGIQTSKGGALIGGYNKETDQGAFVGKDRYGDAYVGKDGNVYKRTDDGWQKRTGDGWENIERPNDPQGAKDKLSQRKESRAGEDRNRRNERQIDRSGEQRSRQDYGQRERTTDRNRSAIQNRDPQRRSSNNYNQLNRDYRSRSEGNRRANTYRQRSSGGSYRGGSSRGGGRSGGSRGGGRRR